MPLLLSTYYFDTERVLHGSYMNANSRGTMPAQLLEQGRPRCEANQEVNVCRFSDLGSQHKHLL